MCDNTVIKIITIWLNPFLIFIPCRMRLKGTGLTSMNTELMRMLEEVTGGANCNLRSDNNSKTLIVVR